MVAIDEIKDKLSNVIYPGFSKSIVDFGFVKDIKILDENSIAIVLEITSSADEVEKTLRQTVSNELEILKISNILLTIKKPDGIKEATNTPSNKNVAPKIKEFVMVSSGKGGVGKSTTSVNIAIALAMQGKKVGLLDADIYGPNIPRMMGIDQVQPKVVENKVHPYLAYGVEVMSIGNLLDPAQAVLWRGSMVMKAIIQLLQDIVWSELDVLVIDMPPGTGDAQLTLAQSVPISAGINVTTPQHVALDDSRRSLDMFEKLLIPIAGIVENMSGFVCPTCDTKSDIFGTGTCDELAKEYKTQILANIPIEPSIRIGGDEGKPIVHFAPESVSGQLYIQAAKKLWESIQEARVKGKIGNDDIQPVTTAHEDTSTSFNTGV